MVYVITTSWTITVRGIWWECAEAGARLREVVTGVVATFLAIAQGRNAMSACFQNAPHDLTHAVRATRRDCGLRRDAAGSPVQLHAVLIRAYYSGARESW